MIQISLRQADGTNKTYTQTFIPMMMLRKAIDLNEKRKDSSNTDVFDLMIAFVVDLFGNQFTAEDFYNGIAYNKGVQEISRLISFVAEGASGGSEGESDPN